MLLEQMRGTPPEGTAARGAAAPVGGRPRAALVIAATSWSLAILGLVAAFSSGVGLGEDGLFLVVDAMVAIVYGTLGGIVLARRRHPVPWILALTALGDGLAVVGGGAMLQAMGSPALAALAPLGFLFGVAWVPGILALFTVVPWLVRDGPLGRQGSLGVLAGTVVSGWATVHQLFLRETPGYLWSGAACLVGAAATLDARHRSRRGPAPDRPGLSWLALGTGLMTVSFVPLTFPALLDGLPGYVVPGLHLAVQAVFPAAVLGVVLRQRLWGIDLAVSRTVTAGVLTAGLLTVYLVVATLTTAILPRSSDAVGQFVAAAVVALTVQPARAWVRRRVFRLVYGEAVDPAAAQRLGVQLGLAGTTEELLGGLVTRIRSGLRLESVDLRSEDRTLISEGTASSSGSSVPLRHGGRVLGELRVTARPGESLDARTRRSLNDLAGIVAAGLALARAADDLERERARVTTARLAERRILRREIHDGLGPALAGLRLGVQGARNLVDVDPRAAAELLDALQEELDGRLDDVRQLSRTLLPPTLEEFGLEAALHELVEKLGVGTKIRIRCTETRSLPTAVVTAAYGITAEAVRNAVRHANPRVVTVDVELDGDRLTLRIADDGTGIAPGTPDGVGSRAMRERAEEQGGGFDRGPGDPRGTLVRAWLPVRVSSERGSSEQVSSERVSEENS